MTAPVLVFGYGNPSGGDDALGPALLERIEALRGRHADWPQLELLTDFQLQVEHALDLEGRARVLFVDASAGGEAPFSCERISPGEDWACTSHSMSPSGLLAVYERITATAAPASFVVAIRGESFDLGEPMSAAAVRNLGCAVSFVERLLASDDAEEWQAWCTTANPALRSADQ